MNPLLAKIAGGVARHGVTILGGWLAHTGLVTESQGLLAAGMLIALCGIGLSVIEKHYANLLSAAQQAQISALAAALQGANTSGQGPSD